MQAFQAHKVRNMVDMLVVICICVLYVWYFLKYFRMSFGNDLAQLGFGGKLVNFFSYNSAVKVKLILDFQHYNLDLFFFQKFLQLMWYLIFLLWLFCPFIVSFIIRFFLCVSKLHIIHQFEKDLLQTFAVTNKQVNMELRVQDWDVETDINKKGMNFHKN